MVHCDNPNTYDRAVLTAAKIEKAVDPVNFHQTSPPS